MCLEKRVLNDKTLAKTSYEEQLEVIIKFRLEGNGIREICLQIIQKQHSSSSEEDLSFYLTRDSSLCLYRSFLPLLVSQRKQPFSLKLILYLCSYHFLLLLEFHEVSSPLLLHLPFHCLHWILAPSSTIQTLPQSSNKTANQRIFLWTCSDFKVLFHILLFFSPYVKEL